MNICQSRDHVYMQTLRRENQNLKLDFRLSFLLMIMAFYVSERYERGYTRFFTTHSGSCNIARTCMSQVLKYRFFSVQPVFSQGPCFWILGPKNCKNLQRRYRVNGETQAQKLLVVSRKVKLHASETSNFFNLSMKVNSRNLRPPYMKLKVDEYELNERTICVRQLTCPSIAATTLSEIKQSQNVLTILIQDEQENQIFLFWKLLC